MRKMTIEQEMDLFEPHDWEGLRGVANQALPMDWCLEELRMVYAGLPERERSEALRWGMRDEEAMAAVKAFLASPAGGELLSAIA